jgi:hypothetical protein
MEVITVCSYYPQIEALVTPKLKSYQSDLKEDESELNNYNDQVEFLHASRSSGTNLFVLTLDGWDWLETRSSISKQIDNKTIFLMGHNDYFLHGNNGDVKEIESSIALKIISDFKQRAESFKIELSKFDFNALALSLEEYRNCYGRTWKSQLLNQWSEGSCNDTSLQRIRNHCFDALQLINNKTEIDKIERLLIDSYVKGVTHE